MRTLDKLYFASVRGVGNVAGGTYPHEHFIRIATVNPDAPIPIQSGERHLVRLEMGENPQDLCPQTGAEITLCLDVRPHVEDAGELMAALNGNELELTGANGWMEHAIRPEHLRTGTNTVELHYRGDRSDLQLADVMIGINHSGSDGTDASYLDRTRAKM